MGVPFGLSNVNIDGLDLSAIDPDLGVAFGVTTLDGWEGAPKPSLEVQARVRGQGGVGGDSYSGPRHVTVGGWIHTSDPSRLLAAKDELLTRFALDERILRVTELGDDRWTTVRREDEPIIKRKSLVYAEFSFQVVSEDSRKFGAVLTGSTALPMTSGGYTYPRSFPYKIPATTVTGMVSLSNRGNESGPVILRIDGPCTGPVVTHRGGGLQRELVFASSLVLGAGEWIQVVMEDHQVLANGQVSRAGWVTSRQWSTFEPGDNSWAFTAAAYNPGSKLTVYATEAWQ